MTEHVAAAPASRFSRVRCASCAMPVRGSHARCWSCGRDPRAQTAPGEVPRAIEAEVQARRVPGRGRTAAAGLVLVLVVLAGTAALAEDGRRNGVRGLASRVRGDGWQRAAVRGASAEFPVDPRRVTVGPGRGLPRTGRCLVAEHAGVRAELVVADVADAGTLLDGAAMAEQIVSGFSATSGGRVVRRTPLYLGGAPGLDAVVDAGGPPVRVRVTVAGTTAYVLAVVGPAEAFERFAGSFRRPLDPVPQQATTG